MGERQKMFLCEPALLRAWLCTGSILKQPCGVLLFVLYAAPDLPIAIRQYPVGWMGLLWRLALRLGPVLE